MTEKIALRYETAPLSSLTYNSGATNQKAYIPLLFDEGILSIDVITGTVLSGRLYQHQTRKFKEYNFTISSDQLLSTTDTTFIQNFWVGLYTYVAFFNGTSWSNYVEVVNGGGVCPLQYADGNIYLPEVPMKLTTINQV